MHHVISSADPLNLRYTMAKLGGVQNTTVNNISINKLHLR